MKKESATPSLPKGNVILEAVLAGDSVRQTIDRMTLPEFGEAVAPIVRYMAEMAVYLSERESKT